MASLQMQDKYSSHFVIRLLFDVSLCECSCSPVPLADAAAVLTSSSLCPATLEIPLQHPQERGDVCHLRSPGLPILGEGEGNCPFFFLPLHLLSRRALLTGAGGGRGGTAGGVGTGKPHQHGADVGVTAEVEPLR